MKLKVPEHLWAPLCEQLLARQDVESAGLLFGESLATPSGYVIAIREAMALPAEAYRVRRHDQLSIDPIVMNRLMRPARESRQSVFTIHTHPGAATPWFSSADDAGDARLMPSISCWIPGVPHGSMVLVNDGTAVARVFDSQANIEDVALRVVGRVLTDVEPADDMGEPWFARQVLALGADGQNRLRRLRVAVVGLGGIGSIVSMQLAHLGIGSMVLLDGDRIEASNLSRIAGAMKDDIGTAYKVDVAARYANAVGLAGEVEVHREFAGAQHEALLGSCDIVVSCVDRHTPRAMLNRLAYRYLVPVIDLGTVFRVDTESSRIIGDAGRVVVLGAGRPCLGCWGHIDPHALRIEALSADDRDNEIAEGYIQGTTVAQPSVVAFNTMVAGAGVIEAVRLTTGFAGRDDPPSRLAFSFSEGTVRRNSLAQGKQCGICGK
ncbi:MAG: ThiF family adenylyltransferase [Gammaproteobacteria bacterium]